MNFLKKLFSKPTHVYNGAFDDRTDKSKDYRWEEVATSGIVDFPTRASVGYTPRNQDGSGSCVAQTTAKMLEVWDFKYDKTPTVYSATPIYRDRSNKPQTGMIGVEALDHPKKNGAYLELDIPSQNMNDTQMTNSTVKANFQIGKPTNYLVMPVNFYAVATEIDNSGAVMLWFKCSYEEWCKDVPSGNSSSEEVRHSVTGVDKISFKGVQYVIIEDSWGTWTNTSEIPLQAGQRAISKEFFDKHCYFAACYTSFSYKKETKPKHVWTQTMKYGQRSEDIKQLQNVLKYEKFFPSNIESTGFFGGMTAKALVRWQVDHDMFDFQNETNMKKVQAGRKTLVELNKIYA